jgi:hypothetical protein
MNVENIASWPKDMSDDPHVPYKLLPFALAPGFSLMYLKNF